MMVIVLQGHVSPEFGSAPLKCLGAKHIYMRTDVSLITTPNYPYVRTNKASCVILPFDEWRL